MANDFKGKSFQYKVTKVEDISLITAITYKASALSSQDKSDVPALIAHLLMPLQTATRFATLGGMLSLSQPSRLAAEDKLAALRRLDKAEHGIASTIRVYCSILIDKWRRRKRF